MSLLADPHHDGSPMYVQDEAPPLGSKVLVRARTSSADPRGQVRRIWIRTTYDQEPVYLECAAVGDGAGGSWWEGTFDMHNPVMGYRFLLERGDEPGLDQQWLTAAGVAEHEPSDAFDFKISTYAPAPDWGRDGVVYQVFPDRFARSAAAGDRPVPDWAVPASWEDPVVFEGFDPRTPLQLFGGDLDGITEHLDHVAAVGASILYTTPVFPAESNHRYNASTFDRVDPLLGGDEAYARLAAAVHERGWRILGDLTTNHTGDTHEWFLRASTDPESRERAYYFFLPDGSYACWMGHGTLPKVNHGNPELRAAFVEGPDSIVAHWLRAPFDLDGWRIDVANMTGRLGALDLNHEIARAVRETAEVERRDALVIGEHNHDASGDIDGDGWHGTMNYSGFSWPVWSWLRDPASPARPFGRPAPVPRRPGDLVLRSLREWLARYGWRAFTTSWNILGSHDSARIRTLVGSPDVHRVAAGLQFCLPGVPMIFAGDEIGLEGVLGEDSRRPMPWAHPETWDHDTLATYAALAAARRDVDALRRGGLRWAHVDEDVMVFLREHPAGSVLVCARRAGGEAVALPAGELQLQDGSLLLGTERGGADLRVRRGTVTVPSSAGPGLWIWRL